MTSLNQTGFQFLLYRYIKKQAREVHAMAAIVKWLNTKQNNVERAHNYKVRKWGWGRDRLRHG